MRMAEAVEKQTIDDPPKSTKVISWLMQIPSIAL